MSRFLRFAAVVMALALVPAMGAMAEPDDTATLSPGESYEFGAHALVGTNLGYFGLVPTGPPGTCNKDPNTTCDTFLIELSNPLTEEEIAADPNAFRRKPVTVTVEFMSDIDLIVWDSDADGTRGTQLGQSASADFIETVTSTVRTTADEPSKWILVDVVYFAHAGPYDGVVQFG